MENIFDQQHDVIKVFIFLSQEQKKQPVSQRESNEDRNQSELYFEVHCLKNAYVA